MVRTMDLRQLIADTAEVHRVYVANKQVTIDDEWYALKLTEELGELTQAYLRVRHPSPLSRNTPEEAALLLADECADLLCHVLLFATKNDIDIVAAIERKWFAYLPPRSGPQSSE
jgi:NTP pyrophosphatase (non-canonical NTP hydrolase)